jgi:hypothetical protein
VRESDTFLSVRPAPAQFRTLASNKAAGQFTGHNVKVQPAVTLCIDVQYILRSRGLRCVLQATYQLDTSINTRQGDYARGFCPE